MAIVTVADVAKRLGKSEPVVREYIKLGLFPFAVAMRREGSSQYDYTIFPGKYEEYCLTGGKPDVSNLMKEGTNNAC